MTIIEQLDDLIKQATTERTHYYVKHVAEKARDEIVQLRKEQHRLKNDLRAIREITDG